MSNSEKGLKELEKAATYLRLANEAQERGLALINSDKPVKVRKYDFSKEIAKNRSRKSA